MWKGETQGRTGRNKRWETRANPAYSTRMRRVETWRGIKHSKRVSNTSHSGPKGLPRFPGVSCRRPLLQGAIRYISTRGRLDPGRQPPSPNLKEIHPRKMFSDGQNVCIVYDMVRSTPAGTVPVTEVFDVGVSGKITSIQAFFEPGPFVPLFELRG